MIDVDRAWQRVSQRKEFQGVRLSDYGYQGVVLKVATLGNLEDRSNISVVFPNGAIILGITAGARVQGGAATSITTAGLDLFAARIDYLQNRNIVGTSPGIGSSVFGTGQFDVFPFIELYIPVNSNLIYEVANLTTSTIDVYMTHHCLVPLNVG